MLTLVYILMPNYITMSIKQYVLDLYRQIYLKITHVD